MSQLEAAVCSTQPTIRSSIAGLTTRWRPSFFVTSQTRSLSSSSFRWAGSDPCRGIMCGCCQRLAAVASFLGFCVPSQLLARPGHLDKPHSFGSPTRGEIFCITLDAFVILYRAVRSPRARGRLLGIPLLTILNRTAAPGAYSRARTPRWYIRHSIRNYDDEHSMRREVEEVNA